jgi:hypothetical protein
MRIYVIRPIRRATKAMIDYVDSYVETLEEQGNKVYDPLRDTDNDAPEWEICTANTIAIMDAERVSVFYDRRSRGSHFDLGVAFTLGKRIKLEKIWLGDEMSEFLKKWQEEVPHPA